MTSFSGPFRDPVRIIPWALLALLLLFPSAASSQICEPELTAVFLVDGVYPGSVLDIALLHIQEVGPATWPSDPELLQIVADAYAGDPMAPSYYHQLVATAGNFRLYLAPPGDFGAATIVDVRTGQLVFAAQVVWMGYGDLVFPTVSSHPCSWEEGVPAAPPTSLTLLGNQFWGDGDEGSQADLAQLALDHLRQTDVLRSFGSCAPYAVTGYLHTPSVGATDPLAARQVLIVSGHAAPPWGPGPIDTSRAAWDRVKAMYR